MNNSALLSFCFIYRDFTDIVSVFYVNRRVNNADEKQVDLKIVACCYIFFLPAAKEELWQEMKR